MNLKYNKNELRTLIKYVYRKVLQRHFKSHLSHFNALLKRWNIDKLID